MFKMKRMAFLALLLAALSVGLSSSAWAAKPKSKSMNDQQKLGYTIGVQLGRQFKQHQVALDSDSMRKGFDDVYSGRKLAMTDKQMQSTMNAFRAQAAAKVQKQQAAQATKNAKAGQQFLKANATKPGVKVTKSGLQYKVLQSGAGPKPVATDWVTVDYKGTLLSGKVFDSSYKRGKPATFPVSGLIPGWTEALQLMHTGATWMIYVPSKLAYGIAGAPMGGIGPNQTLIFKLHLIKIAKKPAVAKHK